MLTNRRLNQDRLVAAGTALFINTVETSRKIRTRHKREISGEISRKIQRVPNSPTGSPKSPIGWPKSPIGSPKSPKWSSKSPNWPPTRLPKMMPTWLYSQDFSKFSLHRYYSVRDGVCM
ncbi:hypothetical protein TNCV_4154981 [Trichonephila clavipes]|nr:hypothetical protein TNCV_4154981 [Trichonephila clavipes]